MKQTKHILATLAMLLCSLTASAHDFVKNGIYYRFNNNDVSDPTVAVTYMGRSADEYKNEYTGHVSIPSTVTHWGKTYRVTEIFEGAFKECDKLTSIYIPSSVTKIGSWSSFYECSGLTAVYISSIAAWCNIDFGTNPLKYAHNLYLNGKLVTKLVIPEGVTEIGRRAFRGCSRLTSVTIPSSVIRIEDDAFGGCSSLEEIIFKDGSTTLSLGDNHNGGDRQGLFYDCPLKKVYLGRNLSYGTSQSEGFSPFYNKKTLESLTIGNGVTEISANAFSGCSGLTSITIPNNVTSIEVNSFSYSSLTSINIPESVTNVGKDAFKGCNFTSVKCPERFFDMFEIYTTVGDFVFREGSVPCLVEYKGSNREVVLPKDFKGKKYVIGKNAFRDVSIVIPEGVTSIGQYAFQGCGGITAITIPDGVTSIGSYAFDNCSSLTAITLPESVTSIGNYAFRDCSSLTSITIPESVTSIGESAFYGCSSLTAINIPKRCDSIGHGVFIGCRGKLVINSNVKMMSKVLEGSKFSQVVFGEGVLKIDNGALAGYQSVSSVVISNGVKSIGAEAFYDCQYLKSVSIPESVIEIGNNAFRNCRRLESVTIPASMTKIAEGAFRDCGGLTSVTFLENSLLDSIEKYAFFGCNKLASITIPTSVTSLGSDAFSNCSNLTSVIAHKSWKKIFKERIYYFDGCNKLEKITYVK